METQITIFATNDIHGHFLGENDAIDFSRLATLKKNNPECLLIDAGDATQGTPLAVTEMGLYPIRIMNAVGYDILTVGNHEFDNITKDVPGVCELDDIVKTFNGIYLSQNVLTKDGKNYLKSINGNDGGTEIRRINGKNILFIGISTPDMSMGIKRMEDFNIQSIEECASELRNIIDLIKKVHVIDAIVAVAHLGSKGSSSKLLAEKLKDIDLIIDGHSHEEYIERTEDQKTLIIQAGCYGKKFSKITLDFGDDNKLSINAELLDKSYLENNAEQDNNVLQILNNMKQEVDKKFGKVWARSVSCTLWGGSLEKRKPYVIDTVNIVRFVETNLGKIVAEAMIEDTIIKINENSSDGENTAEYIIGAINSSGLRDSIVFDSPVFSRNLFMVLPSPLNSRNESGYSVLRILLKDLKKALEHSVSGITLKAGKMIGSDGRFLNLAGVQYELKCDNEGNIAVSDDIILNRMTDYSTKPKHFNLTENEHMSILFCVTKYICQGGDGYDFADKEQVSATRFAEI